MPSFHDTVTAAAPPEEVWKLLYDPSRFPDWWAGVGTVDVTGDTEYTMYPDGYPDFPMPQKLETRQDGRQAVISCLVSNMTFEWRLEPDGDRTHIRVHVDIPEEEAQRLDEQRDVISRALENLARYASAT